MKTVVINGRERIVREIVKRKSKGYKSNCNHKMGENEAININTNFHEDYKRCMRRCGFWIKKIIYFDTDQEFLEFYSR